jgi:uncharacterized membrane protein (DUF485 family)
MKTYLQKLKTVKQLKLKENTFKIYLKELFFVAYLFCISLIPFNLSGQLVAIFNIFLNSTDTSLYQKSICRII